jgi:hypothetical protein
MALKKGGFVGLEKVGGKVLGFGKQKFCNPPMPMNFCFYRCYLLWKAWI